MSTQLQRVHLPPQWPIADQLPLTPIPSKVFERLMSVRFGLLMKCRGVLPNTQFAYIGKVLGLVIASWEWHTPCRVLLSLDRKLELFISTSVKVLTLSTIRGSLHALFCGSWGLCAVCSDTVSLSTVTECRGGSIVVRGNWLTWC